MNEETETIEHEEPRPFPRLTDDELRKFVDDVVSNRVWLAHDAPEREDPLMPFLPLRLGGLPSNIKAEEVGTIWEYMSQRGPRDANGMPTFFSAHIMHIDDWKRAVPAIEEEVERRKNIALDPA